MNMYMMIELSCLVMGDLCRLWKLYCINESGDGLGDLCRKLYILYILCTFNEIENWSNKINIMSTSVQIHILFTADK